MKKIIKNCPLCESNKYIKEENINLNELMNKWISRINFNPISEIYKDEILERRYCTNCGLSYYDYHLDDSKELYEKLEKICGYYPDFRQTFEIAKNIIEEIKPYSILEIGSGNGSFLEYINNMAPIIIGNEYNEKAINICIEKNLNVIATPIEDMCEEFDVICHHEVLEHVFDTKSFLENSIKLLKSGGKLIIGTPDPDSILKINRGSVLHYPPHHQFEFSKKTFDWIAAKYNLKIYDYQKTKLEKRHYDRYISITNDNITFEECSKKYNDHSHVIVFEKQ